MTGTQVTPAQYPLAPRPSSAGQVVRRLVVYTLLFTLVVIAAVGAAGLLALLFDGSQVLAGDNTSSIAQSLAFTLVGGPLAALLWWMVWRRLPETSERGSVAWGLYVAGIATVALIVFSTALLGMLAGLLDGDWDPSDLARALVWAAVWVWHYGMWRDTKRGPLRLTALAPVLGASFGLIVGASAFGNALAALFDRAISEQATLVDASWGTAELQSLIWAIGGGAIWAWHWYRAGVRSNTATLSNVALVVLGILGASIATLGGVGTIVFVALRLAFDRTDPMPDLLNPLAPALAAALVGAVVWVYSRGIAELRPESTRQASVLATSGVALGGAASGIGIIVNSALGILSAPLAGDDTRTLLLGGLSALLVGAPVWWFTWRPLSPTDATAQSTGRRIYLIAVFGISAVVALITLLVIGFRVFEFVLGGDSTLIDRVRAPLGLLTATALVAGYHFSVWRHDRAEADASAPAPRQHTIGEVILVTAAEPEPFVAAIAAHTGARVTYWAPASVQVQAPQNADPSPEVVAQALNGVAARRVLLLVGPGERLEVIPLAD